MALLKPPTRAALLLVPTPSRSIAIHTLTASRPIASQPQLATTYSPYSTPRQPIKPPLSIPHLLREPVGTRVPSRPFLTSILPQSSTPITLHTRRTLPYPPLHLYTIISDIDSYRFFLPNCTASCVTAWTSSTPRLPALADLTVGWGPFTQSYTSRVYCIPGSVVEAVSGWADTTIPCSKLREVGYDIEKRSGGGEDVEGIFESLVTRWTVRALDGENTEVELRVQFRFSNPALGLAVGQVAGDKVDEMVQAFEERARRLHRK